VATLPVPPAAVPGEMLVEADAGDVLLYNTALWHGLSEHLGAEPRYALLSGWSRPWLWRGWTKPPPTPEVLRRAGPEAAAIFGLTERENMLHTLRAQRTPELVAAELCEMLGGDRRAIAAALEAAVAQAVAKL
jgi:hypothetical protein